MQLSTANYNKPNPPLGDQGLVDTAETVRITYLTDQSGQNKRTEGGHAQLISSIKTLEGNDAVVDSHKVGYVKSYHGGVATSLKDHNHVAKHQHKDHNHDLALEPMTHPLLGGIEWIPGAHM